MALDLVESDAYLLHDFKILENSYKYGENRQQIRNRFINILQNMEYDYDVYFAALKILNNAFDLKADRPRFTQIILDEFKHYIHLYQLSPYISNNIKRITCQLLYKINNLSLIESIIKIYKLNENADLNYEEIVEQFRTENKITLLTRVLILLKCPITFDIEIFLIPLFLNGDLSLIYDFLDTFPDYVPEFVHFLDDTLSKYSTIDYLRDWAVEHNVTIRHGTSLTPKSIKRTISKLLNNHSIEPIYFPNSQKRHVYSILMYLIRIRFDDGILNQINFNELIKSLIDMNNVDLQDKLLISLLEYEMYDEAVYWIDYYAIPYSRKPYELRYYRKTNSIRYKQSSNYTIPCKELTISEKCIIMVEDECRFQAIINLLVNVNMIGIDAEWKPFCTQFGKESDLAILQLATESQVFIIDVLKLKYATNIWNELISVLQMFSIVKIGFQLSGDFKYLYATVPNLRLLNVTSSDFIDLGELWRKLIKVRNFKIPFEEYDSCSNISLSTLIKMCFGVTLDKSNQFSNWEQRPLRKDQIIYAAIDAHCLIETYQFLEKHCYQCNVDFEKITNKLVSNNRSKKVFKSTVKTHSTLSNRASQIMQLPNPNSDQKVIIASNFTLVLHMLSEELIRALRITGFQTIVVPQCLENKPKQAVNFYTGAFITLFKNYSKFYKLIPEGLCYGLKSNEVIPQVQEIIQYFNVNIDQNSFYSKCLKCGSKLVKVTEYKNIIKQSNENNSNSNVEMSNSLPSTSQSNQFNHSLYYDSEEDDYDEYEDYDLDYNSTNDYDECTVPVQFVNSNDQFDPNSLIIFCNNCQWIHEIESRDLTVEQMLWYQTLNSINVSG